MGEETLVTLDGRGRLSMGTLATHQRYIARVEADGVIVLTPAVVLPAREHRSLLAEVMLAEVVAHE